MHDGKADGWYEWGKKRMFVPVEISIWLIEMKKHQMGRRENKKIIPETLCHFKIDRFDIIFFMWFYDNKIHSWCTKS